MLSKIVTLVFAVFLFASVASADPIVITSGSVTIIPSTTGGGGQGVRTLPYTFSGANFTATLTSTGPIGLRTCSPLSVVNPPCNVAHPSFSSVGSDNFGSFTLNGTTYNSDVLNQITIGFNVFDIVIPPELQNASGVIATAPFTFSGIVDTLGSNDATLTGEGTVVLFLVRATNGPFTGLYLDHATYTFGPTPDGITIQETPEPATVTLFLTGLAGVGMWRKSRKQT